MLPGDNSFTFDVLFSLSYIPLNFAMMFFLSDPPCKRCKSDDFKLQWVRYC